MEFSYNLTSQVLPLMRYFFEKPILAKEINDSINLWSFIATFNNISVILWQSVLLVEKTRVPKETHWPVASYWQTLSHYVVSSTPCLSRIQTHNVGGDRHWLHKANYHTITTTLAPAHNVVSSTPHHIYLWHRYKLERYIRIFMFDRFWNYKSSTHLQ